MKFLFIANNDFDGVGQTALNLANNLNHSNHNCKLLVLHKKKANNNTLIIKRSFFKRLLLFLLNFIKKDFNELFGFGYSTINFNFIKKHLDNADVIVIFTFYKVISNSQLRYILNLKKKIFLRPLDIEMASGGCHFNKFCNKFKSNCNDCPKLYFPNIFNFPKINLEKKSETINQFKPKILVQNKYVKSVFDKSKIFKNLKKNILYIGTNTKRFNLIPKKNARKNLNLALDEKIILFATFNLNSYIKGGHLLKESLYQLDQDNNLNKRYKIRFITLGNRNNFNLETKNIKWTHFDITKSHTKLNYIFRASDVMVCPSLFCFGPHIVEEALMNKLPVVAYNLGSAQEFVKNGKTGFLVNKYNTKEFANGIKKIISKPQFNFNNKIFKDIINKCNSKNEVKELIKLSTNF